MLGKLIKHEFKSTSRLIPLAYLAVLVFFLISWVCKLCIPDIAAATMVPLFLFIVASVASYLLTLVLLSMRYHKSMYGREGYLTQTLPVSKLQLYFSKLIPFFTWILASTIVLLASMLGLYYLISNQNPFVFLKDLFTGPYGLIIGFFLVAMVIQIFLFIVAVMFCITLANTAPFIRNNVAFAFVFYFLFAIVQGVAESVAMLFIPLSISITPMGCEWTAQNMLHLADGGIVQMGVGFSLIDLGLLLILLVSTVIITKKKINVK